MKEYLNLFDEIQNWNPVDKGLFTIYDGKSFYTAQYRARYGSFDLGGGRFISPTHVLDLSKLTTKAQALKSITLAVLAASEYIQGPDIDATGLDATLKKIKADI